MSNKFRTEALGGSAGEEQPTKNKFLIKLQKISSCYYCWAHNIPVSHLLNPRMIMFIIIMNFVRTWGSLTLLPSVDIHQ